MGKKVLVTGANGFIGRYVVKELCEHGYEVVVLVHKEQVSWPYPIMSIKADICEESVVEQIVGQTGEIGIIVHLAADINIGGSDRTILTNCLGTYHMALLANLISAEQFIYMSSIPVIGIPEDLPVTESHPVKANTLYHITKYAGEQIVDQICRREIRKMVLRISSPIGIGMKENNYLSMLLKKCKSNAQIELYGEGKRIQNYIDVRDVASAILCGILSGKPGLYLIAGRKGITNRDLAFLCKEITGSSSSILWGLREDAEEARQWIISGRKAEVDLSFLPRYKLEESIKWMDENYDRKHK